MLRPPMVDPNAPSPTPESAGIAGAPGALATCPRKTAAGWWAKIATAAMPAEPLYAQTIPVPPADLRTGPLSETPSAASTCANVGHVAAPDALTVGVLAGTAVVADEPGGADGGADETVVAVDVELPPLLLLPDEQPATANPAISTPAAQATLLVTLRSIGPRHLSMTGVWAPWESVTASTWLAWASLESGETSTTGCGR
jgi:hypothetical protein